MTTQIDDAELMLKIEEIVSNYKGDITYLNEAVGIVVVGRFVGWEHQRLVSSRACWSFAIKLFGDPKSESLMPRRGRYAYKSRALALADAVGGFWDIVKGKKQAIPLRERKMMV